MGRKIMLFLEILSGHKFKTSLTAIKVGFKPANCTSHIQLMELRIIVNFKCH